MKIEKYFVLNKYLLSLFGVKDFKELQQKLKDSHEGTDTEGRTYFVNTLISAFSNVKISERELLRYDLNIQEYVRKISYKRNNISLKYFQYLAVLFSEIVLDNLKNKKTEFICNLNEFLKNYEDENVRNFIGEFTIDDLIKLAFYMATGSGKTLIAHINYYQFLNYNLFSPDNIIFITPNEGLSKQHFEELQKSGIPAKIYSGSLDNASKRGNEVLIIEITKFVEEKKGGGVTIPVDVFEGKNLIFVDEGHKGKKSDEQKWAKLRDKLSEKGFVFEYSATFGQVLSEKNKEILKEYSKSIVFDYSYKYFYLDGYGKDFFVANAEKVNNSNFQEIMFVANLLSFYEQLLIYEENKDLAKEYNIEKPLWIFVGTTVAVNKNNKEEKFLSDVIQIVKFIEKAIKDEKWLKKLSEDIINGNTGLVNQENKDIFGEKFKYLRSKKKIDFDDLYEKVFNGKGDLYIYELKNAEGEFGLKVAENPYFGVINIGDTNSFKKQLASVKLNLEVDVVGNSLFDTIKGEHSTINILIGAKKFIEGWDTWRVSSMGLLNIGKTQGPLIIQLFGRGVRLKGKNMSLKRSEGNFDIKYLEILNIYSINADYLKEFLEAIRKEEVEFETIEIPVKLKHIAKWNTLSIPYKDNSKKFEEEPIKLEYDDNIHFTIDLMPRISIYEAKERKEEKDEVTGIKFEHSDLQPEPIVFPNDKIELLNWNKIYQELYEWKKLKRYWNLIIDKESVKSLLDSPNFKLLVPQEIFNLNSKKDIKNLEDIALTIIKRYLEKFYEKRAKEFETSNLTYEVLDSKKYDFPLISEKNPKYIVQIKKDGKDLIKKIRNLLNVQNIRKLYQEETEELPRVYINEHLFLPILLKSEKIDKIIPEGLEKSEKDFLRGLKEYLKSNKAKLKDYKICILRNFSKSGVGFELKWSKFYPDFIMWIKKDKEQIIVFVEPHGLEHSKGLNDEKIQFATSNDPKATTIKKIEENLNKKEKKNHIRLEYFLLSPTEYEKLKKGTVNMPKKEDYENKNVLFLEDDNWPEKLFTKLGLLVNINSKR
jgi:superfamily II DNA or RNA helicase